MQPKTPWIGIALAFYAFIAIGIAEGGLGVLLPSIITTYQLTPATVTALFFSQISGYFVAALTSSLLMARLGLDWMILWAAVSLTSALCIYATTPYWPIMVMTGTLLGLGIGLIDAGINTWIAHDRRADLMGLLHAFYGIGALSGPAIATTLLALGVSWRLTYGVFAALGLLLVIALIGVVSQPAARSMLHFPGLVPHQQAGANLRSALQSPQIWAVGLLLLVYVGTEASLGNWAYAVQTLSRDTPVVIAGYSVTAYWLGLTIGRLSMGQLMKLGAIRLISASLSLLTVGLVIWWLFPQQLWSLPLMGFALATIFPTTIWLMPQRVAAPMVPAAIGFATSLGSVGAVGLPTAMGWLADRMGLEMIPKMLLLPVGVMILLHRWLARRRFQTPNQTG